MATYKLIQDIEADDHILGPLSFRQFVFALISVFMFYLCFLVVTKNVAFLLLVVAPPALFFGFFALPFGRDQPTEVWFLAKLRFWFKPRKRLWDQTGIKELVTINVPKKIEHIYTDGLSQNEVTSRLSALATTLDSRGWAVKNAIGEDQSGAVVSSDRLVQSHAMPQDVPNIEVRASDDILDETSNPIAQQFSTMIDASTAAHRKRLIDELNSIREDEPAVAANPTPNWFMPLASGQPSAVSGQQIAVSSSPANSVAQVASADEMAIADQLRQQDASQDASYSNLRTLQPTASGQPSAVSSQPVAVSQQLAPVSEPLSAESQQLIANSQQLVDASFQNASASTSDPAILSLANNNDLNIATLAREADKAKGGSPDEVVISLH